MEKKIKKYYKIELILSLAFIIATILFWYIAIDSYGRDSTNIVAIVITIIWISIIIAFIINYIIKVILLDNIKTKILLIITPICGIIFSCIFVNGVLGFNNWLIRLIGIVLEIIMIGLYNLFLFNYCGNSKRPYISLILYNIYAIAYCLNQTGLSYIHHYYLGGLIFFIPLSIIESQRSKIKDKSQ